MVDPRTLLEMSLSGDEPRPTTGMIPSQQLEEKRKAFVRPEFDYTQKKRKSTSLPYLTLPSGWAGCYTCPALRPYQFGPMRNPDVTRRSQ